MNPPEFDILLRGGEVWDGLGHPSVRLDIGILNGTIEAIGDLSHSVAAHTLDCTGHWICPGFIDVHSHSDAYQLVEPSAASKIVQGVTTEITGNCGASAAPRWPGYTMPSDWLEQKYPAEWITVADYRTLWNAIHPAVNSAMLIGHRTIRAAVMGTASRAAVPDEIRRMETLLEEALEEGGKGLSSGLVYAPAMFAEPEEIHALARVAARHDGIYTTHMRSEGDRLLESIEETLDVGRVSGVRLQVSHLKTSGAVNWYKCDAALEWLRSARASGLEVAADRYPYTASSTDLDIILPLWAGQGGRAAILDRLHDPVTREKIRAELTDSRTEKEWSRICIGSTRHPDHFPYRGKSILEISIVWKTPPADTVLRLLTDDELFTGGIFFGMNEDNMWKILAEPFVMLGSDASLRAPWGPLSLDHPHPRAYGTFVKFLSAAHAGKTVPVAEAIRKMTSLPADWFRLKNRGRLCEGCAADLVVIQPDQLKERATYAEPHQLAEGVRDVFVNGTWTLKNGQLTGFRAGEFLD